MDPRVVGAGVAMAIGLMVLLPTFNALNNSYVTDVAPPAWLAKLIDPDNLPEDFQPPDDFEPPEDMEIPPDFEPPPGWEPPPGYDGPLPEGGCDNIPPVVQAIDEWDNNRQFTTNSNGNYEWSWDMPQYTAGFRVYVNFTDWQAQRVRVDIEDPDGNNLYTGAEDGDNTGTGLLSAARPVSLTEFIYETPQDELFPPQGAYTLRLTVELPISGSYKSEAYYAVPCGGLLQ